MSEVSHKITKNCQTQLSAIVILHELKQIGKVTMWR